MRALSSRLRPLLAGSIAALVIACGSGDTKKGSSSSSAKAKGTGTVAPTSAPANPGTGSGANAKPTGEPRSGAALNVPVYWGGARYTLGAVNFVKDEGLVIDVEIENLLKFSNTPGPVLLLEADGAVLNRGGLKESVEIVAKSKVKNKLVFGIESFDAAKTTLVFGDGDKAQARIPLSGAGPNVTDEPVKQAFTGDIVIGPATFTVQSVEVRWDWAPHDAQEVKKDKASLVLVGKLKAPSDKEIYVGKEKFELTQPDGSKLTGDEISPEYHLAATKTAEDWYVLFTIDAKDRKFAGDYTLVVTQPWGADGADVSSTPTKLTLK